MYVVECIRWLPGPELSKMYITQIMWRSGSGSGGGSGSDGGGESLSIVTTLLNLVTDYYWTQWFILLHVDSQMALQGSYLAPQVLFGNKSNLFLD